MCFFVCLALPRKNIQALERLAHPFEVTDATAWSIGEATSGSLNRDRSFLITSGGCSCFVAGVHHGSGESKLSAFQSLIRSLLQEAPCVSLLIHDTRGDIQNESVTCKEKRLVSFDELPRHLPQLSLDVRYVVKKNPGE